MPFRSTLRLLWTLFRSPQTFFEEWSPRQSFGYALVVVVVVSGVITAGVAAFGWWFASSIDATTTVTTVEPMPETMCETFNESFRESMNTTPVGCAIDEPRTEQVPIGPMVWDYVVGKLPIVFVALFVYWLLVGVVLHALTAFFDGQGSFWATLSVVGWSLSAELLHVFVGLAYLFVVFQSVEFASDPAVLNRQLRRATERLDSTGQVWLTLTTLLVTGWQAYVWTEGLRIARNLRRRQAAVVAGLTALGVLLLVLP